MSVAQRHHFYFFLWYFLGELIAVSELRELRELGANFFVRKDIVTYSSFSEKIIEIG